MSDAIVEHVNLTVSDRFETARMLEAVFGWLIRWQGKSGSGGDTLHVGNADTSYLAIYTPKEGIEGRLKNGRLNHIGVLVDDLDAIESRVRDFGLEPFNHGDYEPGHRFYFLTKDGIEFEVISYT